jgi:hypothetical protein
MEHYDWQINDHCSRCLFYLLWRTPPQEDITSIGANEKHSFSNQQYSKLPAFKRLEALKKIKKLSLLLHYDKMVKHTFFKNRR